MRIEGAERTGLEPGLPTALRYGACPPCALEHLRQREAEPLVYRHPKPARTTAPGVSSATLPEGPFSALLTGVRSNPKRDTRLFFGRENIALYVCQRTDVTV